MAADEVLNLFDSNWFGSSCLVVTLSKESKTNPPGDFDHVREEQIFPEDLMIQESLLLSSQDHEPHIPFSPFSNHLNVRSQSEHLLESSSSKGSFFSDSQFSPSSVLNLNAPKLQTIISGKEVRDFSEEEGSNYSTEKQEDCVAVVAEVNKKVNKKMRRRRRHGASSKSLSDLEFEELKGFMDLGFVFTEEECRDSNLISIIPGLQRFGEKKLSDEIGPNKRGKDHEQGSLVSRPYLSEAWDVLEIQRKKEKPPPLMNWKFTEIGSEIDMKDQLKFWAHSVASTVR